MLVLTRKSGETILIGNDVEVFVLNVNRGRVKLGFRSSRETRIQRGEVGKPDGHHLDGSQRERNSLPVNSPVMSPADGVPVMHHHDGE